MGLVEEFEGVDCCLVDAYGGTEGANFKILLLPP